MHLGTVTIWYSMQFARILYYNIWDFSIDTINVQLSAGVETLMWQAVITEFDLLVVLTVWSTP